MYTYPLGLMPFFNCGKGVKRNMFSAIVGLLLSTTNFSSYAQNTIIDHFASVDGSKIHYQASGSGSPAVIFEAGGGNDHTTWRKTFPAVSKFTMAFCYDRPGFALSEQTMSPRTYKQIAVELHTLLRNSEVHPPYVLVGHSFGGAIIRAFANLFPTEVSGLVFIDPLNENLLKGWSELEKDNIFAAIDSSVNKVGSIGERQEWPFMKNDACAGFPELKPLTFPDVPTSLLIGGKSQLPYWVNNLIDWYQSTFENSTEANLQVIPYSSHYIHLDEPEVVAAAIKRVVYPDAENVLTQVLKDKGIDSTLVVYKILKEKYPPELLSEKVLNNIGYMQLQEGQAEKALTVFKLNVEMYPNVYSTYESLGEAYMNTGNNELAIKNYEKSLQLNPANTNAVKTLEKLKTN